MSDLIDENCNQICLLTCNALTFIKGILSSAEVTLGGEDLAFNSDSLSGATSEFSLLLASTTFSCSLDLDCRIEFAILLN